MSVAGLKPDLNCIRGRSTRDCMNKIRLGDADLIALDAADVLLPESTLETDPEYIFIYCLNNCSPEQNIFDKNVESGSKH